MIGSKKFLIIALAALVLLPFYSFARLTLRERSEVLRRWSPGQADQDEDYVAILYTQPWRCPPCAALEKQLDSSYPGWRNKIKVVTGREESIPNRVTGVPHIETLDGRQISKGQLFSLLGQTREKPKRLTKSQPKSKPEQVSEQTQECDPVTGVCKPIEAKKQSGPYILIDPTKVKIEASGKKTYTYTICDEKGCDQATITIAPGDKIEDRAKIIFENYLKNGYKLKIIEQRQKPATPQANIYNRGGWQVYETEAGGVKIRITYKGGQNPEKLAGIVGDQIQKCSERFGRDICTDGPPIQVVVYPDEKTFNRATGRPPESPGVSGVEIKSGQIISIRIKINGSFHKLPTVLSHETNHVVVADIIRRVPDLWADEGVAIHLETDLDMRKRHRENLLNDLKRGSIFSTKQLMTMKQYPNNLGLFYAESTALIDFLEEKGDGDLMKVIEFLEDAHKIGYDKALKEHYNMTFQQLDREFNDWLRGDGAKVSFLLLFVDKCLV